jgi:two-component system, NarL family, sensor histidine kinase DesK
VRSPSIVETVAKPAEPRESGTAFVPDSPAGERYGAIAAPRPQIPTIVRYLGPLVGLFFLVYPLSIALRADPIPAQVFVAIGGAALFTGLFLWLMWLREPLQLVPAAPAEVTKVRAGIAFLTVLAIALSFLLSPEWRVLFFHLNVVAGIMLPRKDAYATIAVLAIIQFVVGIPTGLWWLVVPMGALGLWGTAFVNQLAVVAELRAAREALAQRAVAEERLRFARDLHDLLGHSLSLIALKSELAGRLLPVAPERAAKEIGEAEAVARRALREVREAVAGYRQPTLVEEVHGAEEMLVAAGIACKVESSIGLLPKSAEAVLAWAVREGTTNVIRHSRAQHCTIRLAREHGLVRADISDDGRGEKQARGGAGRSHGGSGLSGLAERVAAFAGAEFAAGPRPEGGYSLRVSLPLPDAGADEEGRR